MKETPATMTITQIGLALALIGPALFYSPAFTDAFILPKVLLCGLGAVTAWLGLTLGRTQGGERVGATPLDGPWLAVIVVLGLAAVNSMAPANAWLGAHGSYFGLLLVILCAALYYAAAATCAVKNPQTWTDAFFAGVVLLALWALLQAVGLRLPISGPALPAGRAIAASGTPVFLGMWLAAGLPFALALTTGEGVRRPIGWLGCGLVLAAIVATLSRGALLGALVGGCVCAGALRRLPLGRWVRRPAAWAGVALAAGLLAFVVYGRFTDRADSARLQTWLAAVDVIKAAPLLGVGPDAFEAAVELYRSDGMIRVMGVSRSPADAHCDILQVAATTGLLGLAAYLWWLIALVGNVWRRRQKLTAHEAAAAGALAAVFIQAKFNPVPLPLLAACAAFAGILVPVQRPLASRIPAQGVTVLLMLLLVPLISRAAADRQLHQAQQALAAGRTRDAVQAFEAAAESRHPEAAASYVGFIARRAARTADLAEREQMLARAVEIAAAGARHYTHEARAHHVHGLALFLLARHQQREPHQAYDALRRAARLNPYHLPILELQAAVARALGNSERTELRAEIVRIRGLLPAHSPMPLVPSAN